MNHRILIRFDMPNQRGTKQKCQICNVKFQVLVEKEHQCKRCLRSVCQKCGPKRTIVYDADGSQAAHRCCTVCLKQIDDINEYKNRYKLQFSQDSQFVQQWINKLNKQRLDYDHIFNQYSDSKTSTNQNTIRFKRQSQIIIKDLIDGYNYSLRHFVKVISKQLNNTIVQDKIKDVLISIFGRIKQLPYIPQLIYLVVFFLCFASEAHTYFIITRLIQKIYPQYLRVNKMQKDNLLSSTLKTILQMYRICVGKIDRNQLQVIAQYLEARFTRYVLSFTINICSMPTSFFILNQMLKSGSCLPFYKGIAAIISYVREQVSSFKSFPQVQIPILRTITQEKLRASFIQFEKVDSKFQVTNEVFDSVEHRKLHQKYKQIQSLYDKSQKNLSQKQVKIKQLISQLNLKKKQFELQMQKNKKVTMDLLKLSSNLPTILKYEEMSKIYEVTIARNSKLQQKCLELQTINQKLEKQKIVDEKYKKNWNKIEDDYNKQIVELRTKNEIMEIQMSAKQIDFNTSFLEKRSQQKNAQILMLKQQIKHIKQQLDYYKLKILQKSYSRHGKQTLAQNSLINSQLSKQKQFQRHIQRSNQLIQTLNKQLSQQKTKNQENEVKIKGLEYTKTELQMKIAEMQQLRKVISEVPEQYNYIQAIEQMQRSVERQNNFMKKKALESIKQSFTKCYKQLRFRTIDCKMKQQKIRNSFLIKLFNPTNINDIKKSNEEQTTNDDLFSVIKNIDQSKIDPNDNKNCSIM